MRVDMLAAGLEWCTDVPSCCAVVACESVYVSTVYACMHASVQHLTRLGRVETVP